MPQVQIAPWVVTGTFCNTTSKVFDYSNNYKILHCSQRHLLHVNPACQ